MIACTEWSGEKRRGVEVVRLVRFGLYLWMRIFHGLQFHGIENIPKTGPVLVAANHPSYFDPVVLSLATARVIRFFALAEILKVPIVGWFAKQWGMLPVYPGGNNEPTVQKALRVLQRGGAIGIFPEGRRSLQWAMGEARPSFTGHGRRGRGSRDCRTRRRSWSTFCRRSTSSPSIRARTTRRSRGW